MSFFTEEPDVPVPSNPNMVVRPVESIAVSNKKFAYSNLLTHLEGYKWIVDYYSQYLTKDMEPTHLSLSRDSIYQQFLRIKRFEFRVDSPLSPTQDATTKEFTVQGTGVIYPGFKPNVGDFFVAEIGDGRDAIITITEVEEPTIFKDVAYRIQYRVMDWMDKEYQKIIAGKVVNTKVFVKDFFDYGKNPVIEEDEYLDWVRMSDAIDSLTEYHYNRFVSPEYKNLVIPGQSTNIVDPNFSNYCTDWLHGPYDREFSNITADRAATLTEETLWHLLISGDLTKLRTMSYEQYVLPVRALHWHPVVNPVRYAGYGGIYIPVPPEEPQGAPLIASDDRVFRRPLDIAVVDSEVLGDLTYHDFKATDMVLFHETGSGDTYVLSDAFYNDEPAGQSLLERLVMDVLEGKSVSPKLLLALCELITYRKDLTMFYQIPVLIWMLEKVSEDVT